MPRSSFAIGVSLPAVSGDPVFVFLLMVSFHLLLARHSATFSDIEKLRWMIRSIFLIRSSTEVWRCPPKFGDVPECRTVTC